MVKNICFWCNERPSASESGGGCVKCPTIPYKCTCDAVDNSHDITCERSPNFSGERAYDEERESLYNIESNIRRSLSKTIGEQPNKEEIENIKDTILSALKNLCNVPVLPRYKILKCEQDVVEPTKFTVTFEWTPE